MTPCKMHKEYNCANCGQDNVPECECGISGNFEECPKHKPTERKPVAWIIQTENQMGILSEPYAVMGRYKDVCCANDSGIPPIPLYTSPLTQEEMRQVLEALSQCERYAKAAGAICTLDKIESAIAILKDHLK